jgi:hypothetical protein
MVLHHYGVWKLIWLASVIVGGVVVAMDPTVKVALIVATPTTITGFGTLILGFLNRRDAKLIHANTAEIKASVNGNFTKLLNAKAAQSVELKDKTEQLAHAEGRREGSAGIRVRAALFSGEEHRRAELGAGLGRTGLLHP